jgi:hypothetical protein
MATTSNFFRRHHRKLIAAVLFLIAAIIALWWWYAREQPRNVEKTVQVIVASAAGGETKTQERVITVPRGFSVPDRPLTEEELQAIEDEREVEVCGKGVVKQKNLQDFVQKDTAATDGMIAVSAELRRSANAMDRATGLSVAVQTACSIAQARASPGIRTSCDQDRVDVNATLTQLAQLASTTNDPAIYSLALRTCRWALYRPCEGLSASRWAEIDSGNLAAMMASIPLPKPYTGVELPPQPALDAVLRDATRVRADPFRLDRVIATEAFQSMNPTDQLLAVTVALVSLFDGDSDDGSARLIRYCSAESRDARRTEQCGRIADLKMQNSTSLLSAMIATGIGRSGAWSQDKLAAADTLRLQSQSLNAAEDYRLAFVFSCEGVPKYLQEFTQLANGGELSVTREKLKARGIAMIEPRDIAAMK